MSSISLVVDDPHGIGFHVKVSVLESKDLVLCLDACFFFFQFGLDCFESFLLYTCTELVVNQESAEEWIFFGALFKLKLLLIQESLTSYE